MTGLPWDDPEVAEAGLAAVHARLRTHAHCETLSELIANALHTPRKHGLTGVVAGTLHTMSRCHVAPIVEFTDRVNKPGIDLTRRRPIYGGRITEADLDVDQDRIADAFEEAKRGGHPPTRRSPHDLGWTRDDVQAFCDLDDRLRRQVDADFMTRFRARRNGKAAQQDRQVDDFITAYKRRHGQHPVVHSYGPGHFSILDETAGWVNQPWPQDPYQLTEADARAQVAAMQQEWHAETDEARRLRMLEPYLRVVDDAVDQLAEKAGVPRHLLDFRRDSAYKRFYGHERPDHDEQFQRERFGMWVDEDVDDPDGRTAPREQLWERPSRRPRIF